MNTLIFLALWTLFIVLITRFSCWAHIWDYWRRNSRDDGVHVGGAGNLIWIPPAKAVDPVCGNTVSTSTAKSSVHSSNVHYFCSRECRELFEAAPDLYLRAGEADHPRLEHSHV